MPWKSVGLGVRGKLRSAISLATRGKFSPGEGCTILDVDLDEHARKLDITPWRKVWNKLVDVWDKLETRGHMTAVHKSWDQLHYVLASQINASSRLHVMDPATYFKPQAKPMPLQLYFATAEDMDLIAASLGEEPEEVLGLDEGVIYCARLTPCSYAIPANIRDIFLLQDFLNHPDIALTEDNGDYTVFSEIQPGKKGEIVFGDGVTLNRYMWAISYTEKLNKDLVERFGPEVGYNTVRADEFDTFMDIYYLRMLQLTGVTNRGLELGLTIMQDWPYTRFKCIVLSITGTTKMRVAPYPASALTEGMVYEIENDNELPFQVLDSGTWVDVKPGDVINAGVPLTAAVRAYDLKNYPDLHKDFPIAPLERFHKTVIAYNADIAYLDDEWAYSGYVGAASGFTVGDIVTGSTSGAWGYVTQSMHAGTVGRIELRRVVGTFALLETITDEHGNTATLSVLGDPSYDIDASVTDAYLARNKRTGSDFTTMVWIGFSPTLLFETTYGTLATYKPTGHIETSMMEMFSPSILFHGTALAAMHMPYGSVETDYGDIPELAPYGRIESDYGMLLVTPIPTSAQTTFGGYLPFHVEPGHNDGAFRTGFVVTGATSGATGVLTSREFNSARGALLLRHIQGIFQEGEVITGELGNGDAIADGPIQEEGCDV